jgi:hypothetical protein
MDVSATTLSRCLQICRQQAQAATAAEAVAAEDTPAVAVASSALSTTREGDVLASDL